MDTYTYIDCFLDSGSPTNIGTRDKPIFNLLPSIRDAEAMCVMAVTVPFSYFVIDAASNVIQVTTNSGTNVYNIYLVPGTYTNDQFVTMFNNLTNFNTGGNAISYGASSNWTGVQVVSGGGSVNDLINLKCYVYGTTNQLTFYTSSVTFAFTMDFSQPYNCAQTLGFSTSTTYPATQATIYTNPTATIANVYYVEAPYTVQMTGPPFIYVQSDLAGQIQDGACRTEQSREQILTAIRVNNNYTGMINFTVLGQPEKLYFSKSDLTKLEFSLRLGFRTEYCPGIDSSYYTAAGAPIITNYLPLLGQPYQIHLRFYKKMDTVSQLQMDPVTGDKVTTTASLHHMAGRPSETQFRGNQVTAQMQGPRVIGINPERTSAYPIRRPSDLEPKSRDPFKRRRNTK